jgi:hypothetical protein
MIKKDLEKRSGIIAKCEGCSRTETQLNLLGLADDILYTVYLKPEAKWGSGNCPMATHLKQSKRSMGGNCDGV